MKQHRPTLLPNRHKVLGLQCHIAIARLHAINSLLLQSYPFAIRGPINLAPAIVAIRNLKDTVENLMFDEFPRSKWDSLTGVYSGINLEEFYPSIESQLHDEDNIGLHRFRIVKRSKKRHLTMTEHARVWVILQAIKGTFRNYQNIFLWAYPANCTPYNQAGEIISKVKALQAKIQTLQQKEHQATLLDEKWQNIFNTLNQDCFIFEKMTLAIQTNHMIDQEATV